MLRWHRPPHESCEAPPIRMTYTPVPSHTRTISNEGASCRGEDAIGQCQEHTPRSAQFPRAVIPQYHIESLQCGIPPSGWTRHRDIIVQKIVEDQLLQTVCLCGDAVSGCRSHRVAIVQQFGLRGFFSCASSWLTILYYLQKSTSSARSRTPLMANCAPMRTRRKPMMRERLLTPFMPRSLRNTPAPRRTSQERTAVMRIANTTPAYANSLAMPRRPLMDEDMVLDHACDSAAHAAAGECSQPSWPVSRKRRRWLGPDLLLRE